ncbi:unnamed protein product [Timema podura]|uniref:Serine protease K12H4.7 n=1 Tax=Timema podura TaxID=61482 RepID=A0ABN7NTA0_TIMPD|nr:unnamed protein product [Timema podura]
MCLLRAPWLVILILSLAACSTVPPPQVISSKAIPTVSQAWKSNPSITEDWFDQKLDHFNPADNTTWKQRYFGNSQYHVKGGPVFIFVNGEEQSTSEAAWLQDGEMISLAQDYNATAFLLEHRFYGKSRPTLDTSTESLRYLTVEQTLADLAYFIVNILEGKLGLGGSRVIVFGRSYSANLAAWARLKYPHLVHGAVASSAPVWAKTEFYEYFDGVALALERYSPECVSTIRVATMAMKSLLSTEGGADNLTTYFNLCSPLNASKEFDVYALFNNVASSLASAVQYNTPITAARDSIASACNRLTNSSFGDTPLDRYSNMMRIILGSTSCLMVDMESVLLQYQNNSWDSKVVISGSRQWMYQTCTQLGYYQTSKSGLQPFGEGMFPMEYKLYMCEGIFGEKFNKHLLEAGVSHTNMMYGALRPQVSNVVFVHGTVDPWNYLGVRESRNLGVHTVMIQGTSHCADFNDETPLDSAELLEARQKIKQLVGQWLVD